MKALLLDGSGARAIDIENKLEAFQEAVDGYIETVTLVRTHMSADKEKRSPKGAKTNISTKIISQKGRFVNMKDKEAIRKLIGIVINDSYDKELELLRWLFAAYENANYEEEEL